ncbi:LPS export ABC transporter periplasmic protein LptC [Poseidonibacter ostreae]|mgnify:CR=1 FL=1|jgi:hypothetical protein|uniref:LPS export ABC transporter periplasmic protein LptC n=1 Tax=Poseidonibacter ostreae TaxID=2654171 RepID=A0A6L4WQZ9_9BACT|nr:LPS export ABC transporter periplasmic protein LptC [Poseidonibacter ostreae]KAB7886912.1 hypothetical protein GA417_03870 [Poseidonibacter ostreae]KAB7887591.1 hypothetical protein GBG19_10525 [Poseidonibacter ostreae]KAB7892204.1 hypothetical protein GBG18_03685 [Poseidonibacter ostreae]MAC83734.1 hypothetical protein [Arcobacter sp.]|tara:strand:- start:1117 stop:1650 length:534 start_codon:yes stop_codon:yes gene_type:complete
MDIKFFNYSLLLLAVGAYFIPVDNVAKNSDIKDIPLVIFEKPLMYTLNDKNLSRVVDASHAVRYKSRDEMYDANILLKNNLEEKDYKVETLKAQVIIKKGDDLTLRKDVKYNRDDFINLNTDALDYNIITKVAKNSVPYDGYYYNNTIKGTNLYLDGTKNYMKSNKVHFEVEVKNKK